MTIALTLWGPDDLAVLERSNTPAMTQHLGGPETAEQLRDRQARYLRLNASGEAQMYRIDLDGVAVGGIGFWRVDHDGEAAYETGWSVETAAQGRGIAREALHRIIGLARARGDRRLLVAYPGADNPASNALCRGAGFVRGRTFTEPWRGGELTVTAWVLDLESPVA